MGFFSSLLCSFPSKVGFMPLIPIPPNAFRILPGFCFCFVFNSHIYYLSLSRVLSCLLQASLFLLFWKNKPNNKFQALHTILCPLCVSSRLFFPVYCQISQKKKKKKSLVFTILQRPPFCLKLKGPWWHPSGQTQWSFPSTVSIFEPHC